MLVSVLCLVSKVFQRSNAELQQNSIDYLNLYKTILSSNSQVEDNVVFHSVALCYVATPFSFIELPHLFVHLCWKRRSKDTSGLYTLLDFCVIWVIFAQNVYLNQSTSTGDVWERAWQEKHL